MPLVDPFDASASSATGEGLRGPVSPERIHRLTRATWATLAPVVMAVIALVALAAVPWVASWKLAGIRKNRAETLTPARELVRDIPSALALEVASENRAVRGNAPDLIRRHDEAVAIGRARDSSLGALAPRLGRAAAEQIEQLLALTTQWRAERGTSEAGAATVSLTDLLAAVARLDTTLAQRQARQIVRIQRLEAQTVILPSVLVPLLGVVLFGLYWMGRRMAALANEAELSRLALIASSEQKIMLLRGLTHDLKNALGAAGGFATLLSEEVGGPLTAVQREHVSRIGRIIEQTILAVGDALMIARTEAGALPVRKNQEDLRALVLELASDYLAAAERAGLTLTTELAEDIPPVDTDSSLVSKILGNLLSNAIKYTPAQGRIWLRAAPRPGREGLPIGPWVVVEVCDTGPGIPIAFREKVFDEFFRTPTATTTTRGEGIGLAVSRRVARLLGGEITLDCEDGKGAAFALWLPAPSIGDAIDESLPAHDGAPRSANEVDASIALEELRAAAANPGAPPPYERRRTVQ